MALELDYAQNLRIIAQYRSGGGTGAPVDAPPELQQPFVEGTRDVLDRGAKASDSFRRLLTEIIRGRHVVNIYMARSKKMSLSGGSAERNVTGDMLQQLRLSRTEGMAYAESRGRIAEAVDQRLQKRAREQFRGFLQQILSPPGKTVDLELATSWVPLVRNVMSDNFKRGKLEELLRMGVEIVQGKDAPQAAASSDDSAATQSNKPFGCEVFTPNGVHASANFYLPLWERLANGRLHIDDALLRVQARGEGRQRERRVRYMMRRDMGVLDEQFLKDAELKNRKAYLFAKLELEPYLTPGPGCGSNIVFNLHAKHVSADFIKRTPDGKKEYAKGTAPNKLHPWYFRPVEVGLAHELIHAWRNSAGRTIFGAETYEDEAMVIGYPNYRGAFPNRTENQIREELNLALRPENTRESMFIRD